MSSKKHLDYEKLLLLLKYISLDYELKKVCKLLNCNRTTIYRIILKNSDIVKNKKIHFGNFKNCMNITKCRNSGLTNCPLKCEHYKEWICSKLKSFPYVCNFCEKKNRCIKDKRFFNPEVAFMKRYESFSSSKKKPKITDIELSKFDNEFSPLIANGLSVEMIEASCKDMMPKSSRTIRNWINKDYLTVKRCDLRNAVTRDYKNEYKYIRPSKNPLIKAGRTYKSYIDFMKTSDPSDVIQFDRVLRKNNRKKMPTNYTLSRMQIPNWKNIK